jgi:DNA-binding GntR family transcriptional regulator
VARAVSKAVGGDNHPKRRKPHPYQRVADALRDRIVRGHYAAGDRLPSEAQLCSAFGVSPMTARRALAVIIQEGLVLSEQGRGTFVRPLDLGAATFRLQNLTKRWADDSVDVHLLAASTAKASARVASVLHVQEGQRTVYLRRLLLKHDNPIAYHHEYIVFDARRPLVESQLQVTSIEGLLQSFGGGGLFRANLRVFAANLDEEAADILHEPSGAAALCLEHIFYELNGTPASWGWFLCRSDQFSLETALGPEVKTDTSGGPWIR